ncbi:MAG TPA: thioesterase family protein [Anaerolineales bacterium]|nr:thioesterase family protein [Anaerolineales bacterium]
MPAFPFSYEVEVRYADLDPQRHVNNAVVFSYFEQARVRYLRQLGLWDGRAFDEIGVIVAENAASYKEPITLTDRVVIEAGVTRMGSKSLLFEYLLRTEAGKPLVTGRTVLVAYDYRSGTSIPIPEDWRRRITDFEGDLPEMARPARD